MSFNSQKLDVLQGSLLVDGENQKDPVSSAIGASGDAPLDFKHRRSSSKWSEELSPSGSAITESTQAGELISGSKLPTVRFAMFCYLFRTVQLRFAGLFD